MSDAFSARPWQLWQPTDLGRFDEPAEPELQPEIYEAEDGVDEQQQQLERLQQQMRKEAQGQGYNEGSTMPTAPTKSRRHRISRRRSRFFW